MDASSEKLVVSHYDISLEHISFGYGDRRVIHDISLEIPEHTTCAIVILPLSYFANNGSYYTPLRAEKEGV